MTRGERKKFIVNLSSGTSMESSLSMKPIKSMMRMELMSRFSNSAVSRPMSAVMPFSTHSLRMKISSRSSN